MSNPEIETSPNRRPQKRLFPTGRERWMLAGGIIVGTLTSILLIVSYAPPAIVYEGALISSLLGGIITNYITKR